MHTVVGKVFLTGAGPGDPKLITVKGMETIQMADVILYDRLVSEHLVKLASPNTELIFAGKDPGNHHMKQEEINALLAKKAREGCIVTRLKGGDPFIFGRGGEEALYLSEQGIPYEIVPGISSSFAVPAYAGIPVTHRKVASSVTIVTGHECEKNTNEINWDGLCKSDTLVILMGMARFMEILWEIRKYKSPDTPIALIYKGATNEQQTMSGTLATIVKQLERHPLKHPVTIVIGEVVRLRDKLLWYK